MIDPSGRARVQAGIPTGGQFTTQMRADVDDLVVEPDYVSPEFREHTRTEADVDAVLGDGFPEPDGFVTGADSGMIRQYPAMKHNEERLLKMQFGKPDLSDPKQRALLDEYRGSSREWQNRMFDAASRNEGMRWQNLTNQQDRLQKDMVADKQELDGLTRKWFKSAEDKAQIAKLEGRLRDGIAHDARMSKELAAFNRDWDPFGQGM